MQIGSACMHCIVNMQYRTIRKFKDEDKKREFMRRVMERMGKVSETDTAPCFATIFDHLYEEIFNEKIDFTTIKKEFNDLVLNMEKDLKKKIEESVDPLAKSLVFGRIGNYIDFGALENVKKEDFLSLFDDEDKNKLNQETYDKFLKDLEKANRFLLLADNCGEIVLDRFFIEEVKKRFPHLNIEVMVKGENVMNDATLADATQAGFNGVCQVITTGNGIAGSDPLYLSEEALKSLNEADVIIAKGQANFETMFENRYNCYYSFLCKCNHFADTFNVEPFTGMFVRELDYAPGELFQ